MVTASVLSLESILRANTAHHTVVHNTDTVAEHVSFLHGMRGEHNGTILVLLAVLQDVPQLAARLRVKTSRRLVEEDDLRVGHKTDSDGEATARTQRKLQDLDVSRLEQLDVLDGA